MPTPSVTLYTGGFCGYCTQARAMLEKHGIEYTEINIEDGAELRQQMIARSGQRSVPQIFVGDHHIGGAKELAALLKRGEFEQLLAAEAAGA